MSCYLLQNVKLIPECLLKESAQFSVHFQPNGHDQSNWYNSKSMHVIMEYGILLGTNQHNLHDQTNA